MSRVGAIRRLGRRGHALAGAALAALATAFLAPGAARADGFIVIENPPRVVPGHFSFAPLSVTYHRVSVAITDLVAVTTVDEEFYNPNPERMEGTYVFPLPEGAQIDRLSMDIAGKMIDAELLPSDKARAYYEEIVRKMRDPALLEYAGRGAFRLRIYPIEPRTGKRVRVTYTQLLKSDAGLVEYVYPLSTEKFSSAALKDVSVNVTLDGREPLKSVFSPSHPVEVNRKDERRAVVGWEGRDVWPDTDFRLIFSRSMTALGIDLRTSRIPGEDGYFMLLASAGNTTEKAQIQPKDICFVLDTSGSMAGAKLDQAKAALRFCIANLGADDRFEIIRFSTEAEGFFGALVAADAAHRAKAASFIDGMRATGGTAIEDALSQALALRATPGPKASGGAAAPASGRPYIVIFLTDGLPTVGESSEDALVTRAAVAGASTRIFSFGIGTDVNAHLLDRIAGATRAVSQYVLPSEDIELKVSSFFSRVRDPVLSNLAIRVSNPGVRITQIMPSPLPDLFNGDVLVLFGRYSGAGPATLTVSGTFNGVPHEFSAAVDFPAGGELSAGGDGTSFIPRMWATRRVGWLLDQMRLNGESAELRDEVTRLARTFGIVTPYTAYLVLEDEAARNVPMGLRSFQELQDDSAAMEKARDRLDSVRKEAASEASRAGASAVENSDAVQDMKSAATVAQAAPVAALPKSAPPASGGYRASQAQSYAQQVRVVNGRAFYENAGTWTDSTAQAQKGLAQRQIRFGSAEYFAFVAGNPGAAAWLALGTNIDIVVDGTLVSIRE